MKIEIQTITNTNRGTNTNTMENISSIGCDKVVIQCIDDTVAMVQQKQYNGDGTLVIVQWSWYNSNGTYNGTVSK